MGKTWVFFKALIESKAKQCLILFETTVREQTIKDDAKKFQEVFGIDPFDGVNVIYECYQSAYKKTIEDYFPRNIVFVFADEVHELVTPARWKFVTSNNWNGRYFLGESATIDDEDDVEIGDISQTKYKFLHNFAPVCFQYLLENAVEDGTTRPLQVYIYEHRLSNDRVIPAGSKKTPFLTSEIRQHEYLNKLMREAFFIRNEAVKKKTIMWRAMDKMRFLHSLPSKIEACKQLLRHLPGRTLVFAYDSKTLISLGIPAIVGENKNSKEDLAKFMRGEINQIGSNKMLLQGANLNQIDNLIILAYDSKQGKTTQKIGRLRQDLPSGKVIVFKTLDTQEETWFKSAMSNLEVFPTVVTRKIQDIWSQ